jgi:hypothetical protein
MPRRLNKEPEFRSALEVGVAAQLDALGVEYEYEKVKLKYKRRVSSGVCDSCGKGPVSQRRTYLADFALRNGHIIEVKGYFHAKDRAKMLAVRESNPGIEIRFIFGLDNKLQKSSEKRYSDWCKQHGFRYAIRTVPRSWFKHSEGVRKEASEGGNQE